MSEIVHFRGKLEKVLVPDFETMESVAKQIVEEKKIEKSSWHYDYLDCLLWELDSEFININDVLYRILENEVIADEEDIIKAKLNDDGTIDFELKYYNGGCGFNEALEEAINKIK